MNKAKMMNMQNIPGFLRTPGKIQRKRVRRRQKRFKFLFKTIEILWMIIQIIQWILEFFKKT